MCRRFAEEQKRNRQSHQQRQQGDNREHFAPPKTVDCAYGDSWDDKRSGACSHQHDPKRQATLLHEPKAKASAPGDWCRPNPDQTDQKPQKVESQ